MYTRYRSLAAPSMPFEAQVLEISRRDANLEDENLGLHLNEEIQIDVHAIETVIDFSERGDRLVGIVRQR